MAVQWIPVEGGFLCDPFPEAGEVVIRNEIAYWQIADGHEFVLDLSDEAIAEAKRRNAAIEQ